MMDEIKQTGSQNVQWRSLGLFLLLTFGFSWGPFAIAAALGQLDGEPVTGWVVATGMGVAFGAAAAAFLMRQFIAKERYATANLRWRVPLRYYLLALLLPIGWNSLGLLFKFLMGVSWFEGGPSVINLVSYVVSLLITTAILFGEEFGWRSYCLEKLKPLGYRQALVLSGLIWGIWHVPFVIMPNFLIEDELGPPLLAASGQIAFVTLLGIVIGWLYLSSGSVFVAMLMHGVSNTWASFWDVYQGGPDLNYAYTAWLWCVPLLLVIVILWQRGHLAEFDQPVVYTNETRLGDVPSPTT